MMKAAYDAAKEQLKEPPAVMEMDKQYISFKHKGAFIRVEWDDEKEPLKELTVRHSRSIDNNQVTHVINRLCGVPDGQASVVRFLVELAELLVSKDRGKDLVGTSPSSRTALDALNMLWVYLGMAYSTFLRVDGADIYSVVVTKGKESVYAKVSAKGERVDYFYPDRVAEEARAIVALARHKDFETIAVVLVELAQLL